MKKTYVKPMAAGVAFVVNENVATSLGNDTNIVSGSKLYQQVDGCNTHFFTTDILTGFENKGEETTMNPYDNVDVVTFDKIWEITSSATEQGLQYRACFLG